MGTLFSSRIGSEFRAVNGRRKSIHVNSVTHRSSVRAGIRRLRLFGNENFQFGAGFFRFSDKSSARRIASGYFLFPASGLRRADTNGGVQAGELDNVGSNGYSWSASPYAVGSGNAGNLDFNSNGNVNPLNNNVRSWGFPVRCARAFTA